MHVKCRGVISAHCSLIGYCFLNLNLNRYHEFGIQASNDESRSAAPIATYVGLVVALVLLSSGTDCDDPRLDDAISDAMVTQCQQRGSRHYDGVDSSGIATVESTCPS